MTVRLRAHHLLCMLTFVGEGYTAAFTRNYQRIAERLSTGEDIEIVSGPDDICAPLMGEAEPHCLRESVVRRDALAAEAVGRLVGRAIAPGERLKPDAAFLDKARHAFRIGEIRDACEGCQWSAFCSQVAEDGFAGVKIGVAPPPGD